MSKTTVNPQRAASFATEHGVRVFRTRVLKRGRQTVGVAVHYEGDAATLFASAANAVPLTAHHPYAPEIREKVALFLSPAEQKRRAASAASAASEPKE